MHHQGNVGSVWGVVGGATFSRDDSRILSWADDDTVRLWDAATGRELVPAMDHQSRVRGAAFSRDDSRILSWADDNTVRLWDISRLPAGNLLEVACKLLPSRDVSDIDSIYGIRITDPLCGPDILLPDWSQMK